MWPYHCHLFKCISNRIFKCAMISLDWAVDRFPSRTVHKTHYRTPCVLCLTE
jgi:hypothetical protein